MSNLQFEPKKEDDLVDLLLPGEGIFKVIDATKKISKSGSEMIEIKLKVEDQEGNEAIIYDYLTTKSNFSLRKLRHFCYSCDLNKSYEMGILQVNDCKYKIGKLKIEIQKGLGEYQDKNIVKDYIIKDENKKTSEELNFKNHINLEKQKDDKSFFDDDCNF